MTERYRTAADTPELAEAEEKAENIRGEMDDAYQITRSALRDRRQLLAGLRAKGFAFREIEAATGFYRNQIAAAVKEEAAHAAWMADARLKAAARQKADQV